MKKLFDELMEGKFLQKKVISGSLLVSKRGFTQKVSEEYDFVEPVPGFKEFRKKFTHNGYKDGEFKTIILANMSDRYLENAIKFHEKKILNVLPKKAGQIRLKLRVFRNEIWFREQNSISILYDTWKGEEEKEDKFSFFHDLDGITRLGKK